MKFREVFWVVLLGLLIDTLHDLFAWLWIKPLKRACVDIVPWVENILNQPRDRLLRAAGEILALSVLLLGLLRARDLWRGLRNVAGRLRHRGGIVYMTGIGHGAAHAYGNAQPRYVTASPQFVEQPHWMMWRAAQGHPDVAAHLDLS
jgi:hypothetical protein